MQDKNEKEYKVATIDFTFHNSWLLDMLKERGDYVKWQEWKKLNIINRQITERIREDNRTRDFNKTEVEDYRPCLDDPITAFVSFETEEAYNKFVELGEIEIGGGDSTIAEAPEPTNIIWENYDFDPATRRARFIMILGTIAFVLFLTFCVTFKAKDATKLLVGKYDVSIKCSELNKIYTREQLKNLAADEWLDYYKHGGEEMNR